MKRVFVSEDKIKLDKKVRNEEIEENRNIGIGTQYYLRNFRYQRRRIRFKAFI